MRTAVVLLNLGGPDRAGSVRPFLHNMFSDPAILGVATPVRWLLARVIARLRAPSARRMYAHIGGGSPLLANTLRQAEALGAALGDPAETKVFVAMRYWRPRSDEVAQAVRAFGADRIHLVPLYPQYSGTTTGSSIADWARASRAAGLTAPTRVLCCYPVAHGWIAALAELARIGYGAAAHYGRPRILFSAHGLPKRVVAAGDPYQWQIERTVADVVAALSIEDLDWRLCYQSRIGPLEWIGPSIDEELRHAGRDRVPVVVVPVAFVSEHVETLVELDIVYRARARSVGVPHYARVPAVGTHPSFIGALAGLARDDGEASVHSGGGRRLCPPTVSGCPFGGAADRVGYVPCPAG